MLFNTYSFLVFLAVVMGIYAVTALGWRTRKAALLVASYLFYAAWDPIYVTLIWISTGVDFVVGRKLSRAPESKRGRWLLVSMCTNLGLLAYFKYGGFFLENLRAVLGAAGVGWQPPEWSIVLPVGISFYTFQTMSYTIDIYRGKLDPDEVSLLDFALFVTFFPQLVAGPIVRAVDFLPQLEEPKRLTLERVAWGMTLVTLGLSAKVVLADAMLAPVVDAVYAKSSVLTPFDAWIGTLAFAGQILFDFSGYSLAAIGLALCLGFELPDNFHVPYAARGFSDFWRRWHITLSTWLRDYLYISLGGNRKGPVRTYVNLTLTMLLGGLWHGASWNFVIWGALHGAYLTLERMLRPIWKDKAWADALPVAALGWAVTFIAVCFAWVFFRAKTLTDSLAICAAMLGLADSGAPVLEEHQYEPALYIVIGMLTFHVLTRKMRLQQVVRKSPEWLIAIVLVVGLVLVTLSPEDLNAFIYFQF